MSVERRSSRTFFTGILIPPSFSVERRITAFSGSLLKIHFSYMDSGARALRARPTYLSMKERHVVCVSFERVSIWLYM